MRLFSILLLFIFIKINAYSESIDIFYPESNQKLCSNEPVIIKWSGKSDRIGVKIKQMDAPAGLYKNIINYSVENNTFQWIANDPLYFNTPISIKIFSKDNPDIFDEISGLTVYTKPEIIDQTKSFGVCEGEKIYLQVDAVGYDLSYQWYFDNKEIEEANSSVLEIPNASYKNSGTYICKITTNGSCGDIFCKPISVYISSYTKFLEKTQDVFWEYAKEVSLTARLHSDIVDETDNVIFSWYKDTVINIFDPPVFLKDTIRIKITESQKYLGTKSQNLSISNLLWDDRTNYYCVAEGLCGSDTTKFVIGDENRISITKASSDFYDCEGKDVVFKAKFETQVKGDFIFQWYKAGKIKLLEGDKYKGTNTLQLTIKNSDQLDQGHYYLHVTWKQKGVYKISPPFLCQPNYGPVITYQTKYWVINSRRDYMQKGVYLKISVANIDDLSFQWYKNGKQYSKNGEIRKLTGAIQDTGWYQCKLTNACGEKWSDSIYVAWGYPDKGNCPEKDVVLEVEDFGPQYTYIWLKDEIQLVDTGKIKGSTTHKLVIFDLDSADEGFYKVWAQNITNGYKTLLGNIYVEAYGPPYFIYDFPDVLMNDGEFLDLAVITVISKTDTLFYTLYYNDVPQEGEKFKVRDINNNIDYGFVLGGSKSNQKPGQYQYHFRNSCGELWSNKMTVINTAYQPVIDLENDNTLTHGTDSENNDNVISSVEKSTNHCDACLFPNPVSDILFLKTSALSKDENYTSVQVFNAIGLEVLHIDLSSAQELHPIDLSSFPTGIYYIRFGNNMEKVIKI